jgi:hypothetical protein
MELELVMEKAASSSARFFVVVFYFGTGGRARDGWDTIIQGEAALRSGTDKRE